MQVGVLGPVVVWHEDAVLPLGPPMQRAVFALLALEAGRVVSVQRLTGALWGTKPPQRSSGLLQTYVSRLRANVHSTGMRIVLRGNGYQLDVAPNAVDVHVFRALVAEGLRGDDPEPLRKALALWRGDPLADLRSGALIDRLRSGLAEERLAALEERLDRDLRAGRHPELVTELSRLHHEYPARERLLGLLQLARKKPQAHGPRMLPYDARDFTGRDSEIDRIAALADTADGNVMIAAIDGMAGIGKTALAVHVAHRLADRFPDGQLFLDLCGYTPGRAPLDATDALSFLLRALNIPDIQIPAESRERAALWRDTLARRRLLVVLDNASSIQQVRPLIPGSGGSLVLLTSRRRLTTLDGSVTVSLDVLDEAEARHLFASLVGDRAATEPDAVDEVLALCGHLPLAIRIAGSRLRHRGQWSIAHLATRLRAERHRLAELQTGDYDVRAAFHMSYLDLKAPEQRLLRLLGAHPGGDFTAQAVAAMLGVDLVEAERLLEELLNSHFLQESRLERYRFHDLLRHYAHELTDAGEREEALERLLHYYRYAASMAMDAYASGDDSHGPRIEAYTGSVPEFADEATALAWLDIERINIIALARVGYAGDFSRLLFRYLATRSLHDEAELVHGLALRDPDPFVQGPAHHGLGNVFYRRGDYRRAEAHFAEAIVVAQSVGDRITECRALLNLGGVLAQLGQHELGIQRYEQSRQIAVELGMPLAEARALGNIGVSAGQLGRYHDAMAAYERVLAIFRHQGAQANSGLALSNLGGICLDLERYDDALAYLQEALPIMIAIGDRSGEANANDDIGQALRHLGRFDEAIAHHERALLLSRQFHQKLDELYALNSLGATLTAAGRPEAALSRHEESLAIANGMNSPDGQARAHEGAGRALLAAGRRDEARTRLAAARDLFHRLGYPQAGKLEQVLAVC